MPRVRTRKPGSPRKPPSLRQRSQSLRRSTPPTPFNELNQSLKPSMRWGSLPPPNISNSSCPGHHVRYGKEEISAQALGISGSFRRSIRGSLEECRSGTSSFADIARYDFGGNWQSASGWHQTLSVNAVCAGRFEASDSEKYRSLLKAATFLPLLCFTVNWALLKAIN